MRESDRTSFVRCERRTDQMRHGMGAVKSVLAGTDHIKLVTNVGARLNAALTSRARSSFLRNSMDKAKAPRSPTTTTTKSRSRIDPSIGIPDTWVKLATRNRPPPG